MNLTSDLRQCLPNSTINTLCLNRHLTDFTDRRHRLSTKPIRTDRIEIIFRNYLTCRISLKHKIYIMRIYPLSIIFYFNQLFSPIMQIYHELIGTSIERVLYELFHHRRRALDDLSRLQLIDQKFGESLNWHIPYLKE